MPHNLCIFCVTLLYFSIPISHKPTIIKYTQKNDIKASAISTPSFVTLKFDVKTLFLVSERILTKKKKKIQEGLPVGFCCLQQLKFKIRKASYRTICGCYSFSFSTSLLLFEPLRQ